ncbi:hypothetical protein AB0J72_33690 [Dactylosporangium sp. NPDC049742]|uniref:hypothetical protein n=1 Tax=Dactylosporangium sp. NPDC049742 TaxID=3154737 RepID=UPI00341B9EED
MGETYKRWRLPQLWEMVAADDEADAHVHLATLRRQQTALETQRDGLRLLRDQLADGWPPEKSEAASAFIQRLNDMIRAMSLTAVGAAEVRSRVALVVEALGQARAELAPLVEEYRRTEHLPDQRVGEQARRLLDEHARRILREADAAVADPAAGMDVQLPVYEPFGMQTDVVAPLSGGTGGGGATGGSVARLGGGGPAMPRFDPPRPAVTLPGEEFGLTGGPAESVQATPVGLLPAAGTAAGPGSPAVPSLLGPGRVLGRLPVESSMPGSAAAGGIRGVNSGGGMAGRPVAGAPGVGGAAMRGAAGVGNRDSSASTRRVPREGAGEQWSVEHGVPPVIDVPPVRAHDPGSGVLGLDR